MTAHELAKKLLEGPDLHIIFRGEVYSEAMLEWFDEDCNINNIAEGTAEPDLSKPAINAIVLS
jgi:hypothetical protein